MRKIVTVLAGIAAAAGFSLAAAPSAAAAGPDSGYDCGFSRDVIWIGNAYWNNCTNAGQLLNVVYEDTLLNKTYSRTVCIPAGEVQMIMPTFYVLTADVASSC